MERLSPEGLAKPTAYTQVVVASGRRIVFVSGQVSQDADGKLVAPGDFADQARQAYGNLRIALKAAGATPADVTKLTTYIVGYKPELRPLLADARATLFRAGELPASTLVGVQALAEPGFLIEVEAIAVTRT
ncbi:MAG TPA: RidA family protein [Candidatus Dormibacteraeota bacterium]|nr:RidA family protein [Candidatus Dormibacteraeota bacterium]